MLDNLSFNFLICWDRKERESKLVRSCTQVGLLCTRRLYKRPTTVVYEGSCFEIDFFIEC